MRPGLLRRPRRALLRTRVLVGVLLVTLVVLAAFDVAGAAALRTYLVGQTDSQLRDVIDLYNFIDLNSAAPNVPGLGLNARRQSREPRQYPATISQPGRSGNGGRATHRPNAGPGVPAVVQAPFLQPYSLITVSGKVVKGVSPTISFGDGVVIGNAGLRLEELPSNLAALASSGRAWNAVSAKGEPLRVLAAPDPGVGTIVAMTSLNGVNRTVGQLELILVIGSVVAGALVAGGVAGIMRRGLRPIETMAGQADAITAGDLTSRVGPQDPRSEVGRLGVALNGMLSRIEEFMTEREASQEAARRFFADASHELRTPLASLRANAELYQQGALAERPAVDEAMRRITLEATRMSVLVDDMLRLARLDQQPDQDAELVDLTAVLAGCVERARVADPHRAWRAAIDPGLVVAGDEELLRRAADNLLANVSTHTPPGTVAMITAGERGGTIIIEVSDDGPGVPAAQISRIFDRFYRAAAPSARPGSGLGLAIVTAVAATHGGAAEASLSVPHGLRVAVTLPAASPAAADLAS